MNIKIIGWIIASFNSVFNGNGWVHQTQTLAEHSNTYAVASNSSTLDDRAHPYSLNGMTYPSALTEHEREDARQYEAFIKQLDPNAVVTDEDIYQYVMLQRHKETPIQLLPFAHMEDKQPNRQTKGYKRAAVPQPVKPETYCALAKQATTCMTATVSNTQFCFKLDPKFTHEEIEKMKLSWQQVINTYEKEIDRIEPESMHMIYVEKWDHSRWTQQGVEVLGRYWPCPREGNIAEKKIYHLMQLFLGKNGSHTPKHEMGHVMHSAHTKGEGLPHLISDGIAEYVSLSDEGKLDAAKCTLEWLQREDSSATTNTIESVLHDDFYNGDYWNGNERYNVGPTFIQYIQERFHKDSLNKFLQCKHADKQAQCRNVCWKQSRNRELACPAVRSHDNSQRLLYEKCIEEVSKAFTQCTKQCSQKCISDHLNVNIADFKAWLIREVDGYEAPKQATYRPSTSTYRPAIRSERHTVMPQNGKRERGDSSVKPTCSSLDIVCNDMQKICSTTEISPQTSHKHHHRHGHHHHTDDCVYVTIHNQATNAPKIYKCDSRWHGWIKKRLQEGKGSISSDYANGHIPRGCTAVSAFDVSTTSTDVSTTASDVPTTASDVPTTSATFWVPVVIGSSMIGGTVTLTAVGLRRLYNKYR
ncbi:hypothetical protein [Candidatus Cardinium hertigii]|uniref:Uncharacterized protein n=1 Tax=Candidatus Cardinium hertigii TaxID=247481 RepID=A0A3N2QCE8_9BACT|nr:hypothetical protein [Candidatus Cardinium hertigii]ROT47488.1 hypothetical protein EDM02_02440 [Candidatus Cardinium hertigii]